MNEGHIKSLVEALVEAGHAPDLQLAKQLVEVGVVSLNGYTVKSADYRIGVGWRYRLVLGTSVSELCVGAKEKP